LTRAHDAGATVSGTGIAFTGPTAKAHPAGVSVTAADDVATPGAANHGVRRGAGQ
jgi:hypothetical protein